VGPGNLEAARLLLEGGADPSRLDSEGNTPLMTAAVKDYVGVLRLLLARGAAVDAVHTDHGATAFHAACVTNHLECAEILLRAGCDVGLKSKDGMTGRELAADEAHGALVERLDALANDPLAGAVAQVHGLVGARKHNGQCAAVREHLPAKARYELELHESGQKISVKPANFELVIVPVGLAVEVQGLVGAAEHNGKHGVVESRVAVGLGCIVALYHLLILFTPESLTYSVPLFLKR
jgi:hypothetical protein